MLFGIYLSLSRVAARIAVAVVSRYFSDRAIRIVLTVCGLYCLTTPLLLWVAWTQAIFMGLLGAAALACIVFCLVSLGAAAREPTNDGAGPARPVMPKTSRRGQPSWRDHA